MERRQLLRGILIGLGLLAALMVWVVVWLLTRSPVALLLAHPELPPIVGLAPRSAQALLVLAVPLDEVQAFWQAATPAPQRRATRQQWRKFFSPDGPGWLGSVLAGGSLDFEREVRPWLGKSTLLASLPEWGTLVALETRDAALSQFELNLLWERQSLAGRPVQVDTYKGIQVVSSGPVASAARSAFPDLQGFSAAVFGEQYVLLAEQPAAIRAAIDAWQLPQLSLVAQPLFQQVIQPLREAHVGWAFWQNPEAVSPDGLTLQAVGLGLGVNFQGLVAESAALWHAPAGFSLPMAEAFRPQILQHLPDETLALVSGNHLASVWQSLGQIQPLNLLGLRVDPGQWRQRLQSQVALDWQHLLPEGGEFAFALLPGDGDPAWLWVGKMPDEPVATAGRSPFRVSVAEQYFDLDERVRAQGWQVVSLATKRGTATAWIQPTAGETGSLPSEPQPVATAGRSPYRSTHRPEIPVLAGEPLEVSGKGGSPSLQVAEALPQSPPGIPLPAQVYHADRKGYSYLASSLAALEAALTDPPLGADRAWRKLVAPLPHRNLGYGYGSLGFLLERELPKLKGSRWSSTRFAFATTALTVSEAPYPDQGRQITQMGKLFWQWY
ncbi:MAG TPA: DUF3352 domain-containing protein [Synechococcus sp. M44_DOE_062]|nr:DUF3352 domain-containing protein [Synechococcus sp. M44_DOE_062]